METFWEFAKTMVLEQGEGMRKMKLETIKARDTYPSFSCDVCSKPARYRIDYHRPFCDVCFRKVLQFRVQLTSCPIGFCPGTDLPTDIIQEILCLSGYQENGSFQDNNNE